MKNQLAILISNANQLILSIIPILKDNNRYAQIMVFVMVTIHQE